MLTYTIIIDEGQRARIERALEALDSIDPPEADGTLEGFGVLHLTTLIKDLPKIEERSPGTHHGLCL